MIIDRNKVLLGLIMLVAVPLHGVYTPSSHTVMREYGQYFSWLKEHKKMHSVTNLACFISALIFEDTKKLVDSMRASEANMDTRVLFGGIPFDVSQASFVETIINPMLVAEVDIKYINLKFQHLEMLKKELEEEGKIRSKL